VFNAPPRAGPIPIRGRGTGKGQARWPSSKTPLASERPGWTQTALRPARSPIVLTRNDDRANRAPASKTGGTPAEAVRKISPTEFLFGVIRTAMPESHRPRHIDPSGSAPPCLGVGRLTAKNGVNAVFVDGCIHES